MRDDTASTIHDERFPLSGGAVRRTRLAAAGALLGAVAASACCILPLLLFSLGITGAWLGNLTALAPLQPLFIAVALAFLAYGFYLTYGRRRQAACSADAGCTRPGPRRITKATLWVSVLLIASAIVYPWAAPRLLGL